MKKKAIEFSEVTPLLYASSLPSVLTDPGPTINEEQGEIFTDPDDGDDFESRLNCKDGHGGSCELAVQYKCNLTPRDNRTNAPVTSTSIADGSIVEFKQVRSRQKQRQTNAGRRHHASSAKRVDRKKKHRTHSETDLRKMRPIIASPFMPTLATQISVDLSNSQDPRRKHFLSINNNTKPVLTTLSNAKEVKNLNVPPSVTSINNTSHPINTGLVKSLNQSKYGSLPLKEQQMEVQQKTSSLISTFETTNKISVSSDEDEDEEESSSSSDSESSIYISFSQLTKKQWATVGMLAVANLCSTIAFSCIAPFYPDEAQRKGMNTSEVGIVFGIFELVMFFSAPVLGKYMGFIGSKKMFTTGLLITGITAIFFGFLNFLPSNRIFFWASLTVRFAEALGDACFVTSSFAISAKCFPGRIATIVGIMETFAGLGYTAGPVIGSVLYEYGGFQLPFLALGTTLIFATFVSCYLIEEIDDEPTDSTMGMFSMLKIPVIWLMVFAVVICAISLSFFDPTLSDHLKSFNLSTIMVGLMFLLCGGIYTVTAPLWGLLLDRWHCCNWLMLFGSSATVLSMLLIGPSPLLNFEKNLIIIGIALAILGVAAGALYIPTFQNCLDAVKENGYDDSFQTYGYVSGVFQSAFAFGAFLGPTLGGFSVLKLGFEWTTTIIGFINLLFIFTLLVLSLYKWYSTRDNHERKRCRLP